MLLGAAMSGLDHRRSSGTLPIDDVSDGDLELVGRFAELVDRLHSFTAAAESADTVDEWTSAMGDAVHQLTATPLADVWQVAQFDREMARIDAGRGRRDDARCGTPTSEPSSSTGCAVDRHAPTSAPAP